MNNIDVLNTTIGSMDLFRDEFLDSFIFHIPHSSINIPDLTGFTSDKEIINEELIKLTDWNTDQIFDVPGITTIKAEFSRLFCDVERFPDEKEEMFKYGKGYFYTKTSNNLFLRDESIKQKIYENYYLPYHQQFTNLVKEKLKKHNVYIIDCHSFLDYPLQTDLDKTENRPDICLGVDDYHTPTYLLDRIQLYFENKDFKVKINSPYSGTIIPEKFYQKDNRVKGIMIEINKKLYMNHGLISPSQIISLNKMIQELFLNI